MLFSTVYPLEPARGLYVKPYGTGFYLIPAKNIEKFYDERFLSDGRIAAEMKQLLIAFTKRSLADEVVKAKSLRLDIIRLVDEVGRQYPFISRDIMELALNQLSASGVLKSLEDQQSINTNKMSSFDNNHALTVVGTEQKQAESYILWEDKTMLTYLAEDFRFLRGIANGIVTDNEITEDLRELFHIKYAGHCRLVGKADLILKLFNSRDYLSDESNLEIGFAKFVSNSYKGLYSYYADKLRNFYDEGLKGTEQHKAVLRFVARLDLSHAENGYGLMKIANEQALAVYQLELDRIVLEVSKAPQRFVSITLDDTVNIASVMWDLESRYGVLIDYVSSPSRKLLAINERYKEDYTHVFPKVMEWLVGMKDGKISRSMTLCDYIGERLSKDAVMTIINQSDTLLSRAGYKLEKGWNGHTHLTGTSIGLPDVQLTNNAFTNYIY